MLGHADDELAAYQRVIDDYGQDPAPALREPVARRWVQRRPVGGAGAFGRRASRLSAGDRRLRPGPRPRPARAGRPALVNKGFELGVLGRSDDELAAYQRVIDDYGQDPAPALRERVATVLYSKGFRLGVLGRSDDELAAYQRVIDDYGQDPAPALRERVARALEALQETDIA